VLPARQLHQSVLFSDLHVLFAIYCRQVCEPFRAQIEELKASYTKQSQEITLENDVELETEAWEYTAREFLDQYRFDTVFAADRFGTILQHLQSGNKKAN
jgi:hypothetical protein